MNPNELVLTFGRLHVCVQFGENRRRNATVRVSTDGQTHRRKTILLCVPCYICYSDGADKNTNNKVHIICIAQNPLKFYFFHEDEHV